MLGWLQFHGRLDHKPLESAYVRCQPQRRPEQQSRDRLTYGRWIAGTGDVGTLRLSLNSCLEKWLSAFSWRWRCNDKLNSWGACCITESLEEDPGTGVESGGDPRKLLRCIGHGVAASLPCTIVSMAGTDLSSRELANPEPDPECPGRDLASKSVLSTAKV